MSPYVVILILTFAQDNFGEDLRYWLYLAKMIVGAWCIWEIRDLVPEMKWAFSWEAVVLGVLVCVIWVGLDTYYPKMSFLFSQSEPWNQVKHYEGGFMAIFFVLVRTFGSAIIVPPIEEIFYRSFVYRWFVRKEFENLPLNHFHGLSFVVTALSFGFVHYQWIAGILCGML